MERKGNLIIISAPSGSGKTTVVHGVLVEVEGLTFSVSYTTREPRVSEVHGRDYFFVDSATFRNMQAEGEFLEWAVVHGQLKGTSRSLVEAEQAKGLDVMLEIDVQGALQVKAIIPRAILIYLLPPSYESMERRLRLRNTDREDEIRRRLVRARDEIRFCEQYDYVVINDDLRLAVDEVKRIVLSSRCRVANNLSTIRKISRTFEEIRDV